MIDRALTALVVLSCVALFALILLGAGFVVGVS
jgi:hypothetical protein